MNEKRSTILAERDYYGGKMKENNNAVSKSELPKSFGYCFKLMLFFAIGAIVLFLISYNNKGLSEKNTLILHALPIVFMAIAVVFAIIIAIILIINYVIKK